MTKEADEQGKQSFYFPGGSIGCLLVHGFTGSPSEMRPLGEELAGAGYTVAGVRLAGHGKTPEAMAATRWQDWYRTVEKEYRQLKKTCDNVYAIGLSMGGALCLYGASRLDFKGVISICAPVYLQDRKAMLAPLLQHVLKFYHKKVTSKEQMLNQEMGRFSYQTIPLAALASLLELVKNMRRDLPRIKVPVLVMQSKKDRVVLPKSGSYIFQQLSSNDKQMVWLEESGHLATLDVERDKVYNLINEFIQNRKLEVE